MPTRGVIGAGIRFFAIPATRRGSVRRQMMTTRDRVLIGALAGVGVAWGARQILRLSRRITLDDRVVIVTGASTGHGLMVARYAAEHRARLVLAARDTENLYAAEIEMIHAGARDVLAVPTDVTDREQCEYLVDLAVEKFGRVDILVNNAGIIQVGPAETVTLLDFEAAMATNFWGAVYCALAAIPHMREQRFGRIANVISIGGKVPTPHLLPYACSKYALTGFTETLRTELAKDGILVTGVYPHLMRTGGHVHAWITGDRETEYSLVGLGGTLPFVSTSAESVARRLWRAVCDGDAEVIAGWPAVVAAKVHGLFPNWTAEALALLTQVLPEAKGVGQPVRGRDIRGRIPDLVNRQIPPTARPDVGRAVPGGA
jgi:NAD(P)-dependent dehydrogenase (short-subunit alcohol dehydrogenase family)